MALSVGAEHPELVRGVASLNGAGKFSPTPEEAAAEAEEEARRATRGQLAIAFDEVKEALSVAAGRAGAYAGLFVTKQPLRIKQILRQVYPLLGSLARLVLVFRRDIITHSLRCTR